MAIRIKDELVGGISDLADIMYRNDLSIAKSVNKLGRSVVKTKLGLTIAVLGGIYYICKNESEKLEMRCKLNELEEKCSLHVSAEEVKDEI